MAYDIEELKNLDWSVGAIRGSSLGKYTEALRLAVVERFSTFNYRTSSSILGFDISLSHSLCGESATDIKNLAYANGSKPYVYRSFENVFTRLDFWVNWFVSYFVDYRSSGGAYDGAAATVTSTGGLAIGIDFFDLFKLSSDLGHKYPLNRTDIGSAQWLHDKYELITYLSWVMQDFFTYRNFLIGDIGYGYNVDLAQDNINYDVYNSYGGSITGYNDYVSDLSFASHSDDVYIAECYLDSVNPADQESSLKLLDQYPINDSHILEGGDTSLPFGNNIQSKRCGFVISKFNVPSGFTFQ